MYIHEAIRQAMKNNCYIALPRWDNNIRVQPNYGSNCCGLKYWTGDTISLYGWQPTAEDLMRDDWIVTDTAITDPRLPGELIEDSEHKAKQGRNCTPIPEDLRRRLTFLSWLIAFFSGYSIASLQKIISLLKNILNVLT